jgi:hypothetical protein
MDEPRFDPGGFWEFHLSGGAMRTREGRRVVVLPEDVAGPLVRLALDQGDQVLLSEIGAALGAECAASLGEGLDERSPETVLGHARSVVALFGLGRLSLDRWGDALVAKLEGPPALHHEGLAALLGGLFGALGGTEVGCVSAGGGLFVLVHPDVVDAVHGWISEGADLAAISARLAPATGGAS